MVLEMERYWADHPPLHLMVAAYLGIEPAAVTDADPDLHDLPQEIHAASVSPSEFDALLKARGFG